jgi:hypothetical protein
MWKPWRNLFEPWRKFPGWEFDLLRTLPTGVANRLFRLAWASARQELMKSWQWWAFLCMICGFTLPSFILVWVAAALLGLGGLGKFGLDVAFHLTLGAVLLHPLVGLYVRWTLPTIRARLGDELLRFAEEELAPPEPHRATRCAEVHSRVVRARRFT